jgi:creatinine amidohydrolase
MRLLSPTLLLGSVLAVTVAVSGQQTTSKSVRLEDLTWVEAEPRLGPDTVVVIPLGAAAKEHGPHLKLRNDALLAEHLTKRVTDAALIVVAPAMTYHYYPAFLEYPGSTSLSLATARDMTAEIVRSLARYGPRRFYALNTGISSMRALEPAAKVLAAEGVLLTYTNFEALLAPAVAAQKQEGGSHADELETSMMLYLDPSSVDMTRAVKDFGAATRPLRLSRRSGIAGTTYSPSGIWGDPTLATPEKGRVIVDALVKGILGDIDELRRATPPTPAAPAPLRPTSPPGRPLAAAEGPLPDRCSPGDERIVRQIGDTFTLAWTNADAATLAALWAPHGDIVHPDGFVERGSETIRQNRAELFMRKEYRRTRHPLTLGIVRCITADVAVADGKWELRGVSDGAGNVVPTMEGLTTLVLKRGTGKWSIEAYRYTIKHTATIPPTLLKRPGWPGTIK